MQLRPYQSKVLDDLWSWFATHSDGDPVIEACVGAGKSVMIAEMCRRAVSEYPGTRIVMAVHVRELLQQNYDKLRAVWPQAPAGMYSAGVGQRDVCDITFCTIQTVWKKAQAFGYMDMLFVDECHLISANDASMYRAFITALREVNPGLRVIGWTGTAFRGNGVWLTSHGVFTHVAARVTMRELLDQGFLSPLRTVSTKARIKTDGVAIRQGDYAVEQLAKAADTQSLVEATASEIVRIGNAEQRKKWMVFAVNQRHALHVTQALRALGETAALVTSETAKEDRDAFIAGFRAGRIRCLVNVAVLTTGFDVPDVDLIAMLRPTKSPVLYVQIAGRGMRLAEGKTDCIWLDFTDTTSEQGPVDEIKGRPPAPKKAKAAGQQEAAVSYKLCPECGNPAHPLALTCADCGYEYPYEVKHSAKAGTATVLAAATEEAFDVREVKYRKHQKPNTPPSLRVDYYSGLARVASEWVCFEHQGYAKHKALEWWQQCGEGDIPRSVDEALARLEHVRDPLRIHTRREGKYEKILRREFTAL